jgi:hypothetical protein
VVSGRKHRFGFGIDGVGDLVDRCSLLERLFRMRAAGSQHVQADPCHHGGQPATQVAHLADVGAVHPQPRLLHGVLGLGQRAQHSIGDRPQVCAMFFEPGHSASSDVMIRPCGPS